MCDMTTTVIDIKAQVLPGKVRNINFSIDKIQSHMKRPPRKCTLL